MLRIRQTLDKYLTEANDSEYAYLNDMYSELHRYYHTIEHIEDCLYKLQEVETLASHLDALKLALVYHDLFYDPKRKDNEEKSANYAYKLLSKNPSTQGLATKVREFILLTKHPSIPKTEDEKLLLDIDLSILGSSPEEYAVYEANIRKEYIHVPKLIFKLGRSKLLKKFLSQNRIFHTDFFFNKIENQARDNIMAALQQL